MEEFIFALKIYDTISLTEKETNLPHYLNFEFLALNYKINLNLIFNVRYNKILLKR